MAGPGLALTRASAALAKGFSALAIANTSMAQAATARTATIYAADHGVVADGITANDAALYAAINAAQTAASTYSSAQFCEVVLPAGIIRITQPQTISNNLTAVNFRLRGAGRNSTIILADFFTTAAAPQFSLTGGAGTGAVLYPIFNFGVLVAVRVIAGGSGYTSAPVATLVAATGSGASITVAISGGVVTGATVTAGGARYPTNYAGDALIVIGQQVEVSDLTVQSSAARAAAGNGGNGAYPYFTTNNGIRYEPAGGFPQTVQSNRLERVNVSGQPGHGVNAARQEQLRIDGITCYANGADGLFLHAQGTPPDGIANTIIALRSVDNGCRGLNVQYQEKSTWIDPCIFTNLQAAGAYGYAAISAGAVTGVTVMKPGISYTSAPTVTFSGGGGSGAAGTATIANGQVTGITITSGGAGYTGIPTVAFSGGGSPGLPASVNEEVNFYVCYGQIFNGDVEVNTGSAAGFDLIATGGCYGGIYGGSFRGGRFGINSNTTCNVAYDCIQHVGNAWDVTNGIVYIEGGTGTGNANAAPWIGQSIYNAGNVNLTLVWTPAAQPFVTGFANGTFYYAGLSGSDYTASAAGPFTPDPITNGADQYVTLTGAVAIANPAYTVKGQRLRLILIQDATGGRTVTFGTGYVGANVGSIGSGTANQVGILDLHCVTTGSRNLWVQDAWSGWL